MPKRQNPSAIDALAWMRSRAPSPQKVLSRSQTKLYPDTFSSLYRREVGEEERRQWTVLRRLVSGRDGLTACRIRSPHEGLAVVQHYLIKSPAIDVTGTPEIALYLLIESRVGDYRRGLRCRCRQDDDRGVHRHRS